MSSRSRICSILGKLMFLMQCRPQSIPSSDPVAPFLTHTDALACCLLRYLPCTSSPHLFPHKFKNRMLLSKSAISAISVLSLIKSAQAFSHTGRSQSNKLLNSKSNSPKSLNLIKAYVKCVSSEEPEFWTAYGQQASVFSINTSASSSVSIFTSQSKSLPPNDRTELRDDSKPIVRCDPFSHDVKAWTTALRGKPSVS